MNSQAREAFPEVHSLQSGGRLVLANLVLAAVYVAAGKLGLLLAFRNASASPVWPATGIALAALLVLGYRFWPGILVGAFVVNLTTNGSLATSLGIAVGNTLEGVLGAFLVNTFANGGYFFVRARDIFKFAALAALASTAVSASVGLLSLTLGGFSAWNDFAQIWLTWWLGDATGAILVTPFVLLWLTANRVRWNRHQVLRVVPLVLVLLFIGQAVFGGLFADVVRNETLAFLCLPILVWSAFQFGPRETATATLLLAGIAIVGTLRGFGPFVRPSANESLLLLQVFMGVAAVTALSLASVVADSRRTHQELQETNAKLEERVRLRTDALVQANEHLRAQIGERQRAEELLQEHVGFVRSIIETANDAFVQIDAAGAVTDWNRQAEAIFGWPRAEILGKILGETLIPPRYREQHQQGLRRFLETGVGAILNQRVELTALDCTGKEFPVELTVWPLRTGASYRFNAFVHDISERKRAESALAESREQLRKAHDELESRVQQRTAELTLAYRALKAEIRERERAESHLKVALKEKEVLLKEVQHRVKNNLQVIASLLNLQSASIQDEQARALIQDSQNRVRSMALIHEKFYRSQDLAKIDFADYLQNLATRLVHCYHLHPETVGVHTEVDNVCLGLDTAIPLGLIVNELVSNALKHAFPLGRHGTIDIRLRAVDGGYVLKVRDDGVGLPEGFDLQQSEALGLQLVDTLVEQLGGTLEVESGPGTSFAIAFREVKYKRREGAALYEPSGTTAER